MIDVTRSQPAPASLARANNYNGKEVRERLFSDFLAKCYLCEGALQFGSMQIDHRRGRVPDTLVCDWSNLFPSCKCNQHRPKNFPLLLDPAAGDRVQERLVQWLDASTEPMFAAVDAADVAAANTADELEQVHGRHHAHGRDLRHTISLHLHRVKDDLIAYKDAAVATTPDPRELARSFAVLRNHLSQEAPFTMLVRSVVQRHLDAKVWSKLIA